MQLSAFQKTVQINAGTPDDVNKNQRNQRYHSGVTPHHAASIGYHLFAEGAVQHVTSKKRPQQ